jgi:hypothetical protein
VGLRLMTLEFVATESQERETVSLSYIAMRCLTAGLNSYPGESRLGLFCSRLQHRRQDWGSTRCPR